jgi:hypothetical protein
MSAASPAVESKSELTDGARPTMVSPYVGLVPFSEADAEFFFGREKESKLIASNLRASRLTLLYGPSGVGKSSVLWAGVCSILRSIAQRDLESRGAPDFAVVYFNTWTSDPIQKLSDEIRKAVQSSLEQKTIESIPQTSSLVEIFKTWTERYGIELLVILDQFEEYFLYHGDESGSGTFADELALIINDRYLSARFLISMRDDTLSRLDRFKSSIPNLFDNRLQIDYLDLESARDAITKPVKKYNELYAREKPFTFDHERADAAAQNGSRKYLVEEVLKEVQVGKVTIGVTGQGAVKKEPGDNQQSQAVKVAIEAPYLQLVMKRLWLDETTIATHELTAATLEKLGGSQKIVEQYLDKFMEGLSEREQDIAAAIFYYLVTPSGEKVAHTVRTLTEYTKLPADEVEPLLEKLLKLSEGKEEYRILRKVDRNPGTEDTNAYVVYHDALGPAVLAWSEKHKNEQNKKRAADKSRNWILTIVLIGVAVIGVILNQQRLQSRAAEQQLQKEKETARKREEDLLPYKETIASVIALQSGSADRQAAAISTLQKLIEQKKVDSALEPLITPLLEEFRRAHPQQTEASRDAEAAVKQLAQQSQDTRLSPRVYIQIADDGQLDMAKSLQQQLNANELSNIPNVRTKIIAPGIQVVGPRKSPSITSELRYFHPTDRERQIGEQLIQMLNDAGIQDVVLKQIGGYEDDPDIRPNHFELWLAAAER